MSTFSAAIEELLATADDARRLGPYRCSELLDKGGTAPVFKAVEEHAGQAVRTVAVKVFDIGRAKDGGDGAAWQRRVLDEARALCRVLHPNVIRFHTLATDPKRGLLGLVMEFVEGLNVDQELATIPVGDERRVGLAVGVGIDIAAALAAAHDAGIVHGNVKPTNVLLAGSTHKLINFGIASSLGGDTDASAEDRRAALALEDLPPDSIGRRASTLEKPGAASSRPLVGTIGYTDPLCLRTTAPASRASDLYSLGATLYRVLAGDAPAAAAAKHAGKEALDAKVLLGDAPPPSVGELAPFAPAALVKLVDALVAPAREDRPRSADAVLRALERIRSSLAGHERALPPEERGPFPGLDRYEASDRDVFFGRTAEIAAVTELVRTRGLVGVVGLSGSGKSSLGRAGVLPAIEDGALGGWPARYRSVLVTPGADLMGALRAALGKVLDAPLAQHPAEIAQQLAASVDATQEGLVILVDQLEELVTMHDEARDASRLEALDLLARLAEAPAGVRAIVIARRDLLDEILAIDPQFSRALSRGIHLLTPLSSAAWGEIVDRSLEAYGYRFEGDELRARVLGELEAHAAAMPLAQFGLARLWASRDAKAKRIVKKALDEGEGMRGALERHAEATVRAVAIAEDKLRATLLAMTTPEGGRAHAKMDELVEVGGPEAKKLVRALVSARLALEERAGVTFAHDAVLREWKRLRGWIEGTRDDRVLAAQLERDAARWMGTRDPAELWRKGRLAAAIELFKTKTVPLSEAAWKFADQSAKEEARARLVVRGLAAFVVLLLVGGSMLFAEQARERAAQARRDADALAAALEEVKSLKRQAEESAMEAAATAAMIADLQTKMSKQEAVFGAEVQAAVKKVSTAKDLDAAQKATADLKPPVVEQNQVVPLPPRDIVTGPRPDGPSTTGPADSGAFDQAAIEKVVNSRKSSVKRRCLEKSGEGAGSTKVTATLTIAPSGSVQSVTTSGNDPDVASCIQGQLKSWSFPPPGEVKTVQIPFVFVRQ